MWVNKVKTFTIADRENDTAAELYNKITKELPTADEVTQPYSGYCRTVFNYNKIIAHIHVHTYRPISINIFMVRSFTSTLARAIDPSPGVTS